MSDRAYWEKEMGQNIRLVDEMIAYLYSLDKDITPRYDRPSQDLIGLNWAGRPRNVLQNFATFRQMKDESRRLRIELYGLSEQFAPRVRKAGLEVSYSQEISPPRGRLLILLTPNEWAKHEIKALIQELLRSTYEQAIMPRSQMRRGI